MEETSRKTTDWKRMFNWKYLSVVLIGALLCGNITGMYHLRDSLNKIQALEERMNELVRISMELEQKSQNLSDLAAAWETLAAAPVAVRETTTTRPTVASAPVADPPSGQTPVEIPETVIPLAPLPDSEEPEIQSSPPTVAQAGQTVTVTISAPPIDDLYGYELKIKFNPQDAKYSGGLKSSIADIPTIFAKEFDNYILIGATKVGNVSGYNAATAKNPICALSFTALHDFNLSELTVDGVNVVNSRLAYKENIKNWEITATVTSTLSE